MLRLPQAGARRAKLTLARWNETANSRGRQTGGVFFDVLRENAIMLKLCEALGFDCGATPVDLDQTGSTLKPGATWPLLGIGLSWATPAARSHASAAIRSMDAHVHRVPSVPA